MLPHSSFPQKQKSKNPPRILLGTLWILFFAGITEETLEPCNYPSFLRKQESRNPTSIPPETLWIPVFTGMTER